MVAHDLECEKARKKEALERREIWDQYTRTQFPKVSDENNITSWLDFIICISLKHEYLLFSDLVYCNIGTSIFISRRYYDSDSRRKRIECKSGPILSNDIETPICLLSNNICTSICLNSIDTDKGIIHNLEIPFQSVFKGNSETFFEFENNQYNCHWNNIIHIDSIYSLCGDIAAYIKMWLN